MSIGDFLTSGYGIYYGTERDIKRSFDLKHKNFPIFKRSFDASDPSIVSIGSSIIKIQNHFFVTGEKVTYSVGVSTNSPIGIGTTDFGVGIGTTDKLPSLVYIIKVDDNNIKLARNAEEALKTIPIPLKLTSVGIGSNHSFTTTNKNPKLLLSIDNVIQSPIVSSSTTSNLLYNFSTIDDILYSNSVTNFFIGDFIQIDNEIMKVESVGVGSTNSIRVIRPWLGTELDNHSIGSTITKVVGNYNIVENTIHFVDAPYGNVPLSTTTNPPDEQDWVGISTGSTFHGRVFMRSAEADTLNDPYYKNNVFDDVSSQFNGVNKSFVLTANKSNVTDIYQENAVILINDIFQGPGLQSNYTLDEVSGITSVTFIGSPISLSSDINTSDFPSGGIIVSVGSTEGLGYQPLISAGGTAIISGFGTISSISIGNSGSGYRAGIQTVRVGVYTTDSSNIQFVGTASITNGRVVGVSVTNPGVGYTITSPPKVIFDSPLSYSGIPLIYSSTSSGIGTQATIDIVVGQGSSVIEYELKNIGYGYNVGDILTIPTTGSIGIPTVIGSTFREFQISVDRTFTDKFSGWSLGEIQPLDNIQRLFNGTRKVFPLLLLGNLTAIYAKKGSPISIQDVLLVFINDILQIPGKGYIFNGGSKIEFTEPPKPEDTCKILFYKGSGDGIDVIFRDILETIKVGDDLTLTYDSSIGQPAYLLEDPRFVSDILSLDTVETNPYFGPGNTSNETLTRPITWCRQTEDLFINGQEIGKNRILYEPQIYPVSYLIQPVGVGSSVIFVDNIRPIFNPMNENNVSLEFQKNVTIISQDVKVSASATAIVSAAGTISSIVINDSGSGYDSVPIVSIQSPLGISTITSTATAFITSGIVTSISITGVVTGYSQENPPSILIEPPTFRYESNKVISYSGDFGVITGISTVSVGVASTGIVFDFVIPKNSYFRDGLVSGITTITGITTISGIQTGYYFVISNSNIGNGVTSLNSSGSVIGISTNYLDGVYQVASVSIAQTSVIGLGLTYVAKVTVSVSDYNGLTGIGYSNYYGDYSWGRIVLRSRSKENSYSAYTLNGYSGISTGTVIKRSVPLKYLNYTS